MSFLQEDVTSAQHSVRAQRPIKRDPHEDCQKKLSKRERIVRFLARKFMAVFAFASVTKIAHVASNMQIRSRVVRPALIILSIAISGSFYAIGEVHGALVLAVEIAVFLYLFVIGFGMRFASVGSRVIGYVSFQTIELHLLRADGFSERRRLKSDLIKLVKDGVSTGVARFVLSSPILCNPRTALRIVKTIQSSLTEFDSGRAWILKTSHFTWFGPWSSLNYRLIYGDAFPNGEKFLTRPHRLFNSIPTGIKLMQTFHITFEVSDRI